MKPQDTMCSPHKTRFWLAPDGASHMPYTSTVEGMMRCALRLPFTGPTLAEPCNWVRMVRKTYVWCVSFSPQSGGNFTEQPCLPDPPDLLRSKRNSEHPKIHTPSPLFLQIWEGLSKWRGSRRQDPTKRITAYCLSSEDRMRSLPLHISSRPSNFQCFGGQVQVQVWSCRSIYFNSAVCQLTCLPVSHWQVSRWITLGI